MLHRFKSTVVTTCFQQDKDISENMTVCMCSVSKMTEKNMRELKTKKFRDNGLNHFLQHLQLQENEKG
jgi:hypothetical protein